MLRSITAKSDLRAVCGIIIQVAAGFVREIRLRFAAVTAGAVWLPIPENQQVRIFFRVFGYRRDCFPDKSLLSLCIKKTTIKQKECCFQTSHTTRHPFYLTGNHHPIPLPPYTSFPILLFLNFPTICYLIYRFKVS